MIWLLLVTYLILCRRKNVEAAVEVGMMGIVFENAKQLERDLAALGCNLWIIVVFVLILGCKLSWWLGSPVLLTITLLIILCGWIRVHGIIPTLHPFKFWRSYLLDNLRNIEHSLYDGKRQQGGFIAARRQVTKFRVGNLRWWSMICRSCIFAIYV